MSIVTDPVQIDALLSRGTIVEVLPTISDFRQKLLSGERLRFYIGFDATAPTLHLSHAKNFMLLEQFRLLGHEVIVLFGDFTARIGDPTGESATRKQLTREDVLSNVSEWKRLIRPFMDFDAIENPPLVKYNHDWLSKLTFEDIISLASNFTVQQMLERDMFEKRLNEGKAIHLHEFLYPLMQGYDSVAMDVDVEVCGTDQTFNALAGRTLQKRINNKEKFVVALTLMANPKTGDLMSKSKGTGVFLNGTPEEMYGQIMAQPDEMIELLFVNNTHLPLDTIADIIQNINPRDAKMRLAHEIVALYHGGNAAREAEDSFIATFQKKEIPDDAMTVSFVDQDVVDALITYGFVSSKTDFRRLLDAGAIKHLETDTKVPDATYIKNTPGTYRIGARRFFKTN